MFDWNLNKMWGKYNEMILKTTNSCLVNLLYWMVEIY